MSKHVIDKAKDTAIELSKNARRTIRRDKLAIKKKWDEFKDYILSQNKKADKKAIKRERPNMAGGVVITERAKNGGII